MDALGYRYLSPALPVRFLARPNRYLALVRPENGHRRFEAHIPNPGRMEELLLPGETRGWVVPAAAAGRRTSFDLISVRHGRTTVSIDSRVANRLVGQALRSGHLPWTAETDWKPEQFWGHHRFDFARWSPDGRRPKALLEVKSSNLKVGTSAWFPDAPTDRGRRHLEALARAARQGIRSDVLFVLQRDDVEEFRPNRELDPAFARAFDSARRAGVGLHAIRLRVGPGWVSLEREVPVP